jgi:hypothetical protein
MPQSTDADRNIIHLKIDDTEAAGSDADVVLPIPPPEQIRRVLGAKVPKTQVDPAMREICARRLEDAAIAAGEAMVEMVLRIPAERSLGRDPLAADGAVMSFVAIVLKLDRAMMTYSRETRQHDSRQTVHAAICASHGALVANLTLWAWNEIWRARAREITSKLGSG